MRHSAPSTPKSPLAAAALAAVVPGLGHLYLGQHWKAAGYFVGFFGLEFLGFDFDLTAVGAVLGVPMELGGVALWAHGVMDAYRQARLSATRQP